MNLKFVLPALFAALAASAPSKTEILEKKQVDCSLGPCGGLGCTVNGENCCLAAAAPVSHPLSKPLISTGANFWCLVMRKWL